jgi:hypothetical protein
MRAALLPVAVLVAALLAGCGSSSPTGPASGRPPTTRPAASSGPTTQVHQAADLERAVPSQGGGLPLTVVSLTGAGFSDGRGKHNAGLRCRWYADRGLRCRDQALLAAALGTLRKSLADVAIAVGYNETRDKEIEVQATRVAGASGTQVRDAVIGAMRAAATKRQATFNASTASAGGKSVVLITSGSSYPLGLHRYLYASGDTLFDVRRADDAPAADILQRLPG